MAILEVNDLKLHYATSGAPVRAVDGVSFALEEGEALGIVGESGSGKTSLALALLRVLPRNIHTYTGSVRLAGIELMTLSPEQFRRQVLWRQLSMVFQGAMHVLNPVIKVGQQIAEPLLTDGAVNRKAATERVTELLGLVGLPRDVADRYPHELSGGMKQRVVIATALVMNPRVVVLDEPTSALDVSVQAQIMNLLKRLKAELRLSFVFITHDIALASDLCDRIAIAYAGQTVEQGPIDRVLTAPAHPYTQGLLASVPLLRSRTPPAFIPGTPPNLAELMPGCRFRSRCPLAFERCVEDPPLLPSAQGHEARCWLLAESVRK